jgi:DNA-binding winged helix-turn-helix (wHTH) protein/WD40 repeat protein
VAKIVLFPGRISEPVLRGRRTSAAGRAYNHAEVSTKTERTAEIGAGFRLGEWLVEPSLNRISRVGSAVQLESKAMDVLVHLAGRAGEVVTHAELQDAVWQTEFVSYNTVAGRIFELREALGDDAKEPRYIETITKRGYRLIAEVSFGAETEPDAGVVMTLQSEARDDRPPYPGLAPFSESDAENFFGREDEIAALWRKIASRRLLAVVGASGVGKSSLVRAGIVARAPPGWRAVVCQPGEEPFLAVARALAPDVVGDAEEMRRLLAFHDLDVALGVAARWRGRWDEALLVVDQFEELFTLNPEPVRERFAELLRRLVDGAGIHVLLVLRDDFLLGCHRHPQLAPIFGDLTPIGPPAGRELRQAVTEPAARRLHGFESESMVDEMVGEVETERGALPLLAFAMSRLWELRDRDRRLLTREAYERIGGVGGALAQHAEATLGAIGEDRLPIVRELFRNLVTAQATRAVRERDELLSVFAEDRRPDAEGVLRALVDARLLTSFEDPASEQATGGTRHRVEVVHESLLSAWPRLERWQVQDAEGALLRDQLRQAARTWHERGRTDDLLWSGSAFREYAVWRERYPGRLSELEEAFGRSMVELAGRRRRRRRLAVTAAIVVLVAVAAALSVLWLRSARETRRAEARRLVALGQLQLDRFPAAAVACARASLELQDSAEARRLAVQALWAGPPTLQVPGGVQCMQPAFSLDGRRLACGSSYDGKVTVFSDGGGEPLRIPVLPILWDPRGVAFTPGGDRLLSWLHGDPSIRVFSPSGETLDTLPGDATDLVVLDEDTVATFGTVAPVERECEVRVWSLRDHSSRLVARWRPPPGFQPEVEGRRPAALDPGLRWLAFGDGGTVRLLGLTGQEAGRDLEVGTHPARVQEVAFAPDGSLLASIDEQGGLRVWSVAGGEALQTLDASPATTYSRLGFDASSSRLLWGSGSGVQVWSLADPPDAAPRLLRGPGRWLFGTVAVDPAGRWAAAGRWTWTTFLWSLDSPYRRVLQGPTRIPFELSFTSDSRFLVSCGDEGARLWPLSPADGRQRVITLDVSYFCLDVAADATSPSLLVAAPEVGAFLVEPDGSAARKLVGVPPAVLSAAALDMRGGLAAVGGKSRSERATVYIVDLGSGATRSEPLDCPDAQDRACYVNSLDFAADGSLIVGSGVGVHRWDLATGERSEIRGEAYSWNGLALSSSGRSMIALSSDGEIVQPIVVDLATGSRRRITSHGGAVLCVAMDPTGERVATGDRTGVVRVGLATGEEPHLLLGHSGVVTEVALSPDGRWVASASGAEIFLWPVPDLSRQPLHSLPHDELIAKIGLLTNVRAVRDETSDTGWTIEIGPFPGWRDVPTW